ncbi:hypothetical protein [Microbulbifer sp. JTAC008]|uniref:hypothetical protein n=1 Tax=Microbulbifer sp. JTAC008 TaxID=3243374 RepID=UPI00403978F2
MEKIRVKVTKSFISPVYGEVKEGEREFSRAFAQQLIDAKAAVKVGPSGDENDSKQQADDITVLEGKLTISEEQNSQLVEQLAERDQQIKTITDLAEQLESKVAALEEVLAELDMPDDESVQSQQPQFLEDPAPENSQ